MAANLNTLFWIVFSLIWACNGYTEIINGGSDWYIFLVFLHGIFIGGHFTIWFVRYIEEKAR